MKSEYRIAHLSDLHLSPEYFPERSNHFRSALLQCRTMNVDHIVITGDVTNQSRTKEFEHFRDIVKEFSLLDANKLTVIIGNHDIFGGPYHAEDVLNFPSICKSTDYDARVAEFFKTTKETFDGARFFSPHTVFPFLKIVGDAAIIGMNSVAKWNALKNPIGSNGTVNDDQFELVKSILKNPLVKGKKIVVAIHHHFNKPGAGKKRSKLEQLWIAFESTTMKLRGKKKIVKLLKKAGAEYILHGHVHTTTEYFRNGIHCVNAGGTVITSDKSEPAFQMLTIRGKQVELETIPLQILRVVPSKRSTKKPALTPILAKA